MSGCFPSFCQTKEFELSYSSCTYKVYWRKQPYQRMRVEVWNMSLVCVFTSSLIKGTKASHKNVILEILLTHSILISCVQLLPLLPGRGSHRESLKMKLIWLTCEKDTFQRRWAHKSAQTWTSPNILTKTSEKGMKMVLMFYLQKLCLWSLFLK